MEIEEIQNLYEQDFTRQKYEKEYKNKFNCNQWLSMLQHINQDIDSLSPLEKIEKAERILFKKLGERIKW